MIEVFEWKEDFVTGNEQLDNNHKQIFIEMNSLYKMFSDTKKYHDQICEKIINLKALIIGHCYKENELLEKYNISEKEKHIQAHTEIIKSCTDLDNYNLPPVISGLLLCDIIINYFLDHFYKYDKKFILELNQKIRLVS